MIKRIETKLIKIAYGLVYSMCWLIGKFIFTVFARVKYTGIENIPKKGRFILAANHQNFFDGPLLVILVSPFKRITFVIAKRALKNWFYYYFMKFSGCVIIGVGIEEYQKALKKLNNILTHGHPVGIFPEGDVSNKKLPRRFKGGVAKLSLDSKTKIVPVYIDGTYNMRYFSKLLKRPEVTVTIGKPVELYNYAESCGNDLDKMAAIMREKIVELSPYLYEVKEELKSIQTEFNALKNKVTSPVAEQVL